MAVSGGYDPVHPGHLNNMIAASKMGKVIVLLASDEWLVRKKGYRLIPYEIRKSLIEKYDFVWKVVLQLPDPLDTSAASLEEYKPDIFAKGGDRPISNLPQVELDVCEEHGIEIRTGVGNEEDMAEFGSVKPMSSSGLFKAAVKQYINSEFYEE